MAYTLTEKLWYTADKSKAVKDGDLKAAFLIGPKGFVISDNEAERLSLVKPVEPENNPVEGSSVFSQIKLANGESVVDETNEDDSTDSKSGDENTTVEGDQTDDQETAAEGEGETVKGEESKENKAVLPPENKRQKAKPRTKRKPVTTKKGS